MLPYLDPRAFVGRMLTSWMFWWTFVGFIAVRGYLDTVRGEELKIQFLVLQAFGMALVSAWGYEQMQKQPPPEP